MLLLFSWEMEFYEGGVQENEVNTLRKPFSYRKTG